jgi:hypothetical protein
MPDRWGPKIEALRRLIAPGSGATPAERDTAKSKLEQILKAHHEDIEVARFFEDLDRAIENDPASFDAAFDRIFTTRDLLDLQHAGMGDGSWTGRTIQEAIAMMVTDYKGRRAQMGARPRLGDK